MAEIAAHYAAALFILALEHGVLDECVAQAILIRDALEEGDGRDALEHPRASGADKRALLDSFLPPDAHSHLVGFLHMLIAERQEHTIVPALTAFIEKGTRREEKAVAYVVSAAELNADQIAALESALARKLHKRVTLSVEVDPSLIGGLHIHVNGLVIDHTVQKQLHDLRDTIKKGGTV